MSSPQYVLPDLVSICPFSTSANPHYAIVAPQSLSWFNGLGLFSDKKRAFLASCNLELLSAYTLSFADVDGFRTGNASVYLMYVLDEVCETQGGEDATKTAQLFLNMFLHGEKWDDGSRLSQLILDYRDLFFRRAGPLTVQRHYSELNNWITMVVKESEIRQEGGTLDLASYINFRRETSGVKVAVSLYGSITGVELPDEIYQHPTLLRMLDTVVDMYGWMNDLYSYSMEFSRGLSDAGNILPVVMKEKGLDLQSAVDYVGEQFQILVNQFEVNKSVLPSWGPERDAEVAAYVKYMQDMVSGYMRWAFESPRYFGDTATQIKRTRVVTLNPPTTNDY